MNQGFWECNINRLCAVVSALSRLELHHIIYNNNNNNNNSTSSYR